MADPTYVLLYVRDVPASEAFYASLLDRRPVESSPGFALFVLGSGMKLGLWAHNDVTPAATKPGGTELCISLDDAAAVRATHAAWKGRGLAIAQEPTQLDFGYTFVALDADGHRLRVFTPTER